MKKKHAIKNAADLAGGCCHHEYMRGMCELLATIFPKEDVLTYERADWFERKIQTQIEKD